MVNDLRHLLRENVADAPIDHVDLDALVGAGRRRARRRRRTVTGGVALVAVGAVATAVLSMPGGTDDAGAADRPPAPDAPTLRLADAQEAVEGRDYRELASYTNENLNRDNGQYLDGVTDDGLILFRDGPRLDRLRPRFALMDPATGEKDWLPGSDIGQTQTWPVELSSDRLVLLGYDAASGSGSGSGNGLEADLTAYVFDREARAWSTMAWAGLPAVDVATGDLGPDGRLYVTVPATRGTIPEGGWPTGPDGEAEDADAEGDTHDLWSVSLSDPTDVRDEGLRVGDVAFTDSALVWTDSSNGSAGMVHVRDLASGEERSFDPNTGERCNLLGFGASGERIVMSQYCGTYGGGVRDDRVQILSTDGDQVVTLQDSGVDGWLPAGSDVVNVSVFSGPSDDQGGTYAYDLTTDRFLRMSDAISNFGLGGPTGNDRQLLWHTPVNNRQGATQRLGELLP